MKTRMTRLLRTTGMLSLAILALMGNPARAADTSPDAEPIDGGTLYALHCANCHGMFGEGDGIITPSLAVVLQDLRYLSQRNSGEFPRDFVVEIIDGRAVRAAHGPEGMPVWGAELARDTPLGAEFEAGVQARIEALADFLERMQIGPAQPVDPAPDTNP